MGGALPNLETGAMKIPVIRLSDPARRASHEAAVEAGGDPLRIT